MGYEHPDLQFTNDTPYGILIWTSLHRHQRDGDPLLHPARLRAADGPDHVGLRAGARRSPPSAPSPSPTAAPRPTPSGPATATPASSAAAELRPGLPAERQGMMAPFPRGRDAMADNLRYENRMSDADALMWTIEKDPMLRSTITAIALLDRAPDHDRLREVLLRGARLIPRLTQRVRAHSYSVAPPRWEDDPNFDIDYHLRFIRAPEPGDLRSRPRRRPADRHGELRPGPPAVGGHGRRGARRRRRRPDHEGAPHDHRRRRQREAGAGAVRPRARPRRRRWAARSPVVAGPRRGRSVDRRPHPRAAAAVRHPHPLDGRAPGRGGGRGRSCGHRSDGCGGPGGRRGQLARAADRTGHRAAVAADDRTLAVGPLRLAVGADGAGQAGGEGGRRDPQRRLHRRHRHRLRPLPRRDGRPHGAAPAHHADQRPPGRHRGPRRQPVRARPVPDPRPPRRPRRAHGGAARPAAARAPGAVTRLRRPPRRGAATAADVDLDRGVRGHAEGRRPRHHQRARRAGPPVRGRSTGRPPPRPGPADGCGRQRGPVQLPRPPPHRDQHGPGRGHRARPADGRPPGRLGRGPRAGAAREQAATGHARKAKRKAAG